MQINKNFKRNRAKMGSGQKYGSEQKVIPGDNIIIKAIRCICRKLAQLHKLLAIQFGIGWQCLDYHLMGVGTNLLGYSHPEIDNAVIQVVKNGNMSTLNAPEEVTLAERLIQLDPWAGMVRFARQVKLMQLLYVLLALHLVVMESPFVDTTDGTIGICQQILRTMMN